MENGEDLTEKSLCGKRSKKRVELGDISGRGSHKCKASELKEYSVSLKNSKEGSIAG